MSQLLARLSPWRKQIIKRRGPGIELVVDQLLAHRVARGHITGAPVATRSLLRFAARICATFPSEPVVSAVFDSLDDNDPLESLKFVNAEAGRRRKSRQEAAVDTASLLPELEAVLGYLSRSADYPAVPIRIASTDGMDRSTVLGESILAYTDSTALYLSPRIATSPHFELSQAFAVYIVAHELGHLIAGSFDYDPKSKHAKRVEKSFAEWPEKADEIDDLIEMLKAKGVKVEGLYNRAQSGMQSLISRLSHPHIARSLLNALEDGRLERQVVQPIWPGLAAIHQLHDRVTKDACEPSDRFLRPLTRLINAICFYATGRERDIQLEPAHRRVFEQAARLIDFQMRQLGESLYDSLSTLARIYKLIEPVLQSLPTEAGQMNAAAEQNLSLLEIELRHAENSIEAFPDLELDELLVGEDPPATDEGVMADELLFSGSSKAGAPMVDHNSVQVIERVASAPRQPNTFNELHLPFPALQSSNRWQSSTNARSWSSDGPRIANHRLAMYHAASLAGAGDTVQIAYKPQRLAKTLSVTLLFDLSISMEMPRKRLNGQTPISRAIEIGNWFYHNLADQDVDVEVYGGIDAGRRPVKLVRYPGSREEIFADIEPVGFGGFRLGPMARALPHFRQQHASRRIDRHALIVFTDAAGLYLQRRDMSPLLADLHQNCCRTCRRRHNCTFEGAAPDSHLKNSNFPDFLSPAFAWRDVGHAFDSQPTEFHHVFVLSDKIPRLEITAGIGDRWSDASTQDGISAGALRLAQFANR